MVDSGIALGALEEIPIERQYAFYSLLLAFLAAQRVFEKDW
jgi:hypothetical protein